MFAHGNGAGKQMLLDCLFKKKVVYVYFEKIWTSPAKRVGPVVSGTRARERDIFWDAFYSEYAVIHTAT